MIDNSSFACYVIVAILADFNNIFLVMLFIHSTWPSRLLSFQSLEFQELNIKLGIQYNTRNSTQNLELGEE